VLIVYEDNQKWGKKGKSPNNTRANSLACPKAKFHPSLCEGGAIEVKSKSSKIVNMNRTKDKTTTYTCRNCST
jgi:hypothetical protein